MQRNHSERHQTASNSNTIFNVGATTLLVATVVIIFVAEASVMLLLYFLNLPPNFSTGIIDAALLSLFVAPALYFTFLKPMREAFLKRDQSEEAQRRLEEIDRMKNDFISIAAHELRTPLATIMGYSEMLQNDLKPDQREAFQKVILKEAETLNRLIDDLEVVNQLEVEKNLPLKQTQNDLQETVNHVCAVYRQKFPEMPIQLNFPEGPLPMTYDEVRISQVFDNLLSNAVKYSSGFQDLIEVSATNYQDQVSICVKDKGIGMTREETQNIFNMFFRAETKKAIVGGLGLGMAIVKNIIDKHNGSIDIVSQKNVGTVVTVILPKLAEPQVPEQNLNSHTSETILPVHDKCLRVALPWDRIFGVSVARP
jgi:signal transduction histidine kinase